MVSHGSWQRRFGGGDIVGRSVRNSGEPVTVVGVMPAGFGFPQAETELWVPLAMDADEPIAW